MSPAFKNPKVVLPVAVLACCTAVAVLLVAVSAPVASRPPAANLLAVRVMDVSEQSVALTVQSQGTVAPRTESNLIPEVSGSVTWMSPALASGGFFEEGDVLLHIDARDYQAAVERAKSGLIRARAELSHSRQTLERRRGLSQKGVASDAELDDAERTAQVARAGLREAEVALEQAERDLERTEIRAPYRGRVREENVDLGQFLNRGQGFATLYATDYLEVRLPIPDEQLAYLDLPNWGDPANEADSPAVALRARFAGSDYRWDGRIVRTEGEIDPRSRMVHVVARVDSSQDGEAAGRPALSVGLFVRAEIEGRRLGSAIVIPRRALREDNEVFVIDENDRLRFRSVEILRIQGESVVLRSGLTVGERICLSPIRVPIDGMKVDPVPTPPTSIS